MKKGYIYVFIILAIIGAMWKAYRVGFDGGVASEQRKISAGNEAMEKRLMVASKKILDLQRIIAYNNDECFNRVWPDDIIEAVNP